MKGSAADIVTAHRRRVEFFLEDMLGHADEDEILAPHAAPDGLVRQFKCRALTRWEITGAVRTRTAIAGARLQAAFSNVGTSIAHPDRALVGRKNS